MNYIQINTGIGMIHKDLIGIRHSYNEALKVVPLVTTEHGNHLKTYRDDRSSYQYSFSNEEENKLNNYLIGGYRDDIDLLIQQVLGDNIRNGITELGMKELLIHIYNVCVRVSKFKGLNVSKLMGDQNFDIFTNYRVLPVDELESNVKLLITMILSSVISSRSKINVKDIVKYIDDNYMNDIYLDQIAQKYHTSGKYLSRLFKETMGVAFQQYLTNLRMDKARKLLLNSKKNIQDISIECGFSNRNTFERLFRKSDGISPSQYRKMNSTDNILTESDNS